MPPTSIVDLIKHRVPIYLALIRLDKPIGTFLLMWPTLWALWVAAEGVPDLRILAIFLAGVFLMRSAGCVINDVADRNIDGQVTRTHMRPLARKAIPTIEAVALAVVLTLIGFFLVLMTNTLTVQLSVVAVLLAATYPFMKRYTHLPQVVLGAAFAWSIPMAFAAVGKPLGESTWLMYIAAVLWTVSYDTLYAMVDREDDLKIGVKSTAILFGDLDRVMIGALQVLCLFALHLLAKNADLGLYFYLGLGAAGLSFAYQQWLIQQRQPIACFDAFINNNWTGMLVYIGLVAEYQFP